MMRGPLPPVAQIRDFLPPDDHRRLIDWVLANRANFTPAVVTKGQSDSGLRVDPTKRIATISRTIGPLEPMLRAALLGALPALAAKAGVAPRVESLELELAAHGDGAFFVPHTDLPTGPSRRSLSGADGHDRILSAVYYFRARPSGFTGGELRLFRYGVDAESGAEPDNHLDLSPIDNSLVAFPSSAIHEVRLVRCPSGAFENRRFALNCWYCRPL